MGRVGWEVDGFTFPRSFIPPADQQAFFEIEIPVLYLGRTDPIFENPFLATQSFLREGRINRLRPSPGFEDLVFRHTGHHPALLNMFLKIRISQLNRKRDHDHHQERESQPCIDDFTDEGASNKRWLVLVDGDLFGGRGRLFHSRNCFLNELAHAN